MADRLGPELGGSEDEHVSDLGVAIVTDIHLVAGKMPLRIAGAPCSRRCRIHHGERPALQITCSVHQTSVERSRRAVRSWTTSLTARRSVRPLGVPVLGPVSGCAATAPPVNRAGCLRLAVVPERISR